MRSQLRDRILGADGIFTTEDAYACGYDQATLRLLTRSGEVRRVRRGAFVDSPTYDDGSPERRHSLRARAVQRSMGVRIALSHHSALAVCGLPLLDVDWEHVHLTRFGSGNCRTTSGVSIHPSLPIAAYQQRHGEMLVGPAHAALQTAALYGVVAGVVPADAAMNQGLLRIEQLGTAAGELRVASGLADVRAVVRLANGLSESPGESRSRLIFAAIGLPEPQLQVSILDDGGQFVGRVDFLFVNERTIVEFDGLVKYGADSLRQDLIAEKRREDRLRMLGFQVVRLVWADLQSPARVSAILRAAFARTVASPT